MLPIKDMTTQDMATITKVCFMDMENFILRVLKVTIAQNTKLTSIGITSGRIMPDSPEESATSSGMLSVAPTIARRIELILRKDIKNIYSP